MTRLAEEKKAKLEAEEAETRKLIEEIKARQAEADNKLTRVGSDPQIWRCKSTMEIDIIATTAILSHFALLNRNRIFRQIIDSFCLLCCSKLCTRKLLEQLLCQTML